MVRQSLSNSQVRRKILDPGVHSLVEGLNVNGLGVWNVFGMYQGLEDRLRRYIDDIKNYKILNQQSILCGSNYAAELGSMRSPQDMIGNNR